MQTRWLSLFQCLDAFIRAYGPLLLFFKEQARLNGANSTKAEEYLLKLTEAETLFGFRIMYFLLQQLHNLSEDLQTRAISREEAYALVKASS